MTDDKTKSRPNPKSKNDTDQSGDSEPEVVEQAKELVEKGKAKSREFYQDVCEDLKKAKAATVRKSGSWLNAAFKTIEDSAKKVVKKTEKAAKEERKAVEAAKKQRAQANATSTAPGSTATRSTATRSTATRSKLTGAGSPAAKKTAKKKSVKKKAAKKKSAAKKVAAKKSTVAKKKTAKKQAGGNAKSSSAGS